MAIKKPETTDKPKPQILANLERLREDSKARLDMSLDKDFATLARLLMDIDTRIEAFGEAGELRETALDEFTRKLRERQGA